MIDVIALGELLIDFTCVDKDGFGYPVMAAHPGGAPANYLAALSKYGNKTALFAKIGSDAFGRLLLDTVKAAGIDDRGIILSDDVFTTLAFVTLDENGDREFSFARNPGADTRLCADEIDYSLIDEARVFHFGTLSLTDEPSRSASIKALDYAVSRKKLISFDPNLRKPLWQTLDDARAQMLFGLEKADVIKISDDEVFFLFGLGPKEGGLHILKEFNASLVFVTCGKDGAYALNDKAMVKTEELKGILAVDTTGAGDIFGGSAMHMLLEKGKALSELNEKDLLDITRFACAAASLSTMEHGGISSVPKLDSVKEYLKSI